MSFERLPLALALSLTIAAGGLFAAATQAKPLLESQVSCSGYDMEGGRVLLVAAKDSGDVSADSPAGSKSSPAKDDKAAAKKAKAAEKEEAKAEKEAKKAQKAEKTNAKEAADDGDKKKPKVGFFHKRNPEGEEKKEETTEPAAHPKKETAEEKESTRDKAEAKAPPAFVPDDALISVLKDVSKALADGQNEQVAKVENENEKVILGLAEEILAKALAEPNLPANRIVPKTDEGQIKSALTAESWSSGDVVVNDKLRGSLAAVWAKRIGGLLTVTIAGDAGQRKTPDGNAIGEFMVMVTAHSPVQSGFDIQSQGDVTFWMGKLSNIAIEASCVPIADAANSSDKQTTFSAETASPSSGEAKKKLVTFISPLLTNRYRKYETMVEADRQAKLAASQAEAEAEAARGKAEPASGDDGKPAVAQKEGGNVQTADNKGDSGKRNVNDNGDKREVAVAVATGEGMPVDGRSTAATVVDAGPRFHMPGVNSTLLMPDRALAGQYVTVALLDRSRAPETNVELSFNGASLATDEKGQAVYQIPDDANPGRSLNVALSARPDEVPATVEVLQPLNITTGQPPKLDRMTPLAVKDSIMTIDGHNFDGIASKNTVIVDGSKEGKVISASPFQLKLLLPPGLSPGAHSLCVSTDGNRSNLGGFDFADTVVTVDGKDNGKENCNVKLLIKVIGTSARMNVKILNQTPDVLKLNRGAEMTVTSSGGFDNTIQLFAVRGKKGAFNIETQIEM